MKIKDITVYDYYTMTDAQRFGLTIFMDGFEPEKVLTFKKKNYEIHSINNSWFTFDHRLFLQTAIEERERVHIALSILLMAAQGDEWNPDSIVKYFKLINQLPIMKAYPIAKKFWEDVATIEEKEKMLASQPTAEEIQAGIEELYIFAEWGTVDHLAKRLHMKHQDVVKLPYSDCFLMLLKDKKDGAFQERYQKVLMNKK